MRKITSYLVTLVLANVIAITAFAQNVTISGNVRNSASKEATGAVSVTVKGSDAGTFTDDRGNFRLSVKNLPVTLLISSIGYELQEVTVSKSGDASQIDLKPANTLGQEVVVSASRVPQRILESPVSIERINAATIRNAPAASYYDILANLKGVDFTTSSLTFKTPTTRGFAGSGNTRVNQIVDGMDNQAPGLNFSVGGVVGLTQLDVDNVELLPGASSALYGPGGMNGTILISSKSPFKYQGLSFEVKTGIMNTDSRFRSTSAYHNWTMRWAKKVNEKLAFKVGMELVAAKDWLGYDYRNYSRTGTNGQVIAGDRATDPNYDGVNVYGDELTRDIRALAFPSFIASAPFLKGFLDTLNGGKPLNISRTGYAEKDMVNPNTLNYKLSGAIHYKLTSRIEAVLAGHWGTGNTVYTGSDRYSLRALKIGQYKFELNNKNWYLRAYTTQENAGESYNATATASYINEAWKPSTTWFSQYSQAYVASRLAGNTDFDAQTLARATADQGRPLPGTAQFTSLLNQVRSVPISKGGGLFVDKTNLYQIEGQANLSKYTSQIADILIGASYKRYVLNSQGTLFADSAGKIPINEYGAYVQASRSFLHDVLKLTFSGRYDKNENFDGRFTPRATAVIKVAKNNSFRVSYQTAYRFPSTQQQWIDLLLASSNTRLIGGNDYFINKYGLATKPTFELSSTNPATVTTTQYQIKKYKPESVTTYEVGYKGLVLNDRLLIDAFGYYGQYQDFIVRTLLIQPNDGNVQSVVTALANNVSVSGVGNIFSLPTNTTEKVKTFGWGLSLDYKLTHNFVVSGNFSSDQLDGASASTKTSFNTPKYRANISLANTGFGKDKRVSFNVVYRWQDAFQYDGDFANGYVESTSTLDAQLSYKLPMIKSSIKIGANNLLNQYYINGIGNSIVGGLYYVGFAYNVF